MLWGGARGQYLGHHRFCLTSWSLVDRWILCLRCWFSVTQTLTWIYVYRSVTYISWSSDFALYLEDYLLDKCHNSDIVSMWCKDLPHKMYVGQWPTFHGTVILSISWRVLDELMLYWRYWFSVTQTLNWKYVWAMSWESLFLPLTNTRGADQSAQPRSLISAFVVRCLDSIMPLVSISKISSL